jgi:hypothetical protein
MCKLCKDTFSRSDILKRHFQKCSIRRGVPGDTDHLEGSRAHNQRNRLSTGGMVEQQHSYLNGAPAPNQAYDNSLTNHLLNQLPNYLAENQQQQQQQQQVSAGLAQAYADNVAMSNRSSRSNSMMRPQMENRRSVSGFDTLAPSRTGYEDQANYALQSSLAGMNSGMPAYSMPAVSNAYAYATQTTTSAEMMPNHQVLAEPSNGMSTNGMFGQNGASMASRQGEDPNWGMNYQNGGPENFAFPHGPVGGGGSRIKAESDLLSSSTGNGQDPAFSTLYSNSSNFAGNQVFDGWDLGDRTKEKLAALVAFCFANGIPRTQRELDIQERLRIILTVDNVNHFMKLFRNFQTHWPILHMPTFNALEANDGLVLTMVTIGAIYSDSLGLQEVRWLMEICKTAINRSFRIFKQANIQMTDPSDGIDSSSPDIEEIQALVLLQVMFVWHGNPQQRHNAREEYWKMVRIARQSGLLRPVALGQPGYSVLHQSSVGLTQAAFASWSWNSWVSQEKRMRAMFLIYLMDCALVIFFNRVPEFDASELQIQLPSDDAAWEAGNEMACREALGLLGQDAQERTNQSGSRRVQQPEFHKCVKLLLAPQNDFTPRSTNIYSKFILIHALHVKIWNIQHQPQSAVGGFAGSVPGTPLSQNDWVISSMSHPNSGRATPTEPILPQSLLQGQISAMAGAINKWKRSWDTDIDIQYPTTNSPSNIPSVRRVGFCRDAIHFYFLAIQFLDPANSRALDARSNPDTRMRTVMMALKRIRTWVGSKDHKAGREPGSVVSIDDDYGVDDLNLDMKLLFTDLGLGGDESETGGMQNSIGLLP